MKSLQLIALGIILFFSSSIQAQVSVNVTIGKPPAWGPAGYNAVDYYYLPDIESYYDTRSSQFIYFGGGKWVRSRNLPSRYRNYDLYKGYKVVLKDYHGDKPYGHYKQHKIKYRKGYKGSPQRTIGSRKVFVQKNKTYYKKQDHHDNRKGFKGHQKDHKKH
ncbi:hypothetical protein MW871_11205 [Flavobacterium sp. I-SCBP12n]|uniref:Uncharacterized protein n=1 Tax=Flavobacterium pygoscelis TaxID=2893176 RepID=A0A9X1XS15_9FLAO|nr:hypothetical protein [Flavobacterium pygoscelis]MCK8142460.1 hypothetical protein [Flavobacterium pygoscelis]